LEERGFIRRLAHRARALEIVKLPEAMERVGFKPRVVQGSKPAYPPPRPVAALAIETSYAMDIPMMGRIAAGVPIEAIQHISHHVTVPNALISGKGAHYALEVKGDSMIEAGINDGDIVIIQEQQDAENGDIVVALVEDAEATLKRFRRKGTMIALEAANPIFETRVFPSHMVKVQGKLVGLIRSY
jgi:repressor LexA